MITTAVVADGRETVDGDPLAIYELGSITKPFTGILLAEMAERGEVALGDRLDAHLDLPGWNGAVPTLEELATHRSGLPNTPRGFGRREAAFVLGVPGTRNPWEHVDDAAFWRALASTKRRRPRKLRYSSIGFELLGRALASRAGTSYEELVLTRVCRPLGMGETWVHVPASTRPRLVQGRNYRGAPRPPLEDPLQAAGGLRSSAADMLLFLQACIEPPEGTLGRALAVAQEPWSRVNRRLSIGLGWVVMSDGCVWHNGGTWGFRTFAGFRRRDGRAAVVLSTRAFGIDRRGFRLLKAP